MACGLGCPHCSTASLSEARADEIAPSERNAESSELQARADLGAGLSMGVSTTPAARPACPRAYHARQSGLEQHQHGYQLGALRLSMPRCSSCRSSTLADRNIFMLLLPMRAGARFSRGFDRADLRPDHNGEITHMAGVPTMYAMTDTYRSRNRGDARIARHALHPRELRQTRNEYVRPDAPNEAAMKTIADPAPDAQTSPRRRQLQKECRGASVTAATM